MVKECNHEHRLRLLLEQRSDIAWGSDGEELTDRQEDIIIRFCFVDKVISTRKHLVGDFNNLDIRINPATLSERVRAERLNPTFDLFGGTDSYGQGNYIQIPPWYCTWWWQGHFYFSVMDQLEIMSSQGLSPWDNHQQCLCELCTWRISRVQSALKSASWTQTSGASISCEIL